MAKNKIDDLRNHLFETLEALKDTDKPMDLARAHAISEVAQTIINSAKVEVDLARTLGDTRPGSAFFPLLEESRELPRIPAPVRHDGAAVEHALARRASA